MRLFSVMQTAYEYFDNTLKNYLSRTFNILGLNGNHTKIYNIIFDGIKGVMQNIMFYIEDAFTEQNIFTASRKKSVYSLAKLSGYEPYYGSAASGTLLATSIRGSVLESSATKIFIPNSTVITNTESNRQYILQLATNEHVIDITKPLVTHEFKIVEGNIRVAWFTAKGVNLETFIVSIGLGLFDKSYVTIKINGNTWGEAASLYDMGEDEEKYVITIGYDGSFEIMFGDGIYGKKLNPGDSIYVEWISHAGDAGNISFNQNTNFIFNSSGRDSFGNKIDLNKYINLSLKTSIAGGTNSDSIKTIRSMIGYNSRSMILATEDNFQLFFKRFSFIGRANCWSHESSMKVIAVCTSNKITDIKDTKEYFSLNVNDLYLSLDYKDQIITALTNSNRVFAGISLEFYDPVFVRYAAICIIKVKDNYNKDSIKEQVREIIGNYFINLPEGVQKIYKSEIIANIMNNVSEIESFDIQFISEIAEKAYKNKYYEITNIEFINGNLMPRTTKVIYEKSNTPGLDKYGNIVLNSRLEIPLLQGGFSYYNKDDINKDNSIRIETLQYIFI